MFWSKRSKAKEKQHYTNKIDVFSFAVILWELWHSPSIPWEQEIDEKEIEKKVKRGERPLISEHCPSEWKKLLHQCWAGDPVERFSFDDVVAQVEKCQIKPI